METKILKKKLKTKMKIDRKYALLQKKIRKLDKMSDALCDFRQCQVPEEM